MADSHPRRTVVTGSLWLETSREKSLGKKDKRAEHVDAQQEKRDGRHEAVSGLIHFLVLCALCVDIQDVAKQEALVSWFLASFLQNDERLQSGAHK